MYSLLTHYLFLQELNLCILQIQGISFLLWSIKGKCWYSYQEELHSKVYNGNYKKSEKIRQLFCLLSYYHLLVVSNQSGWYFCKRKGLHKFSKYISAYVMFFFLQKDKTTIFLLHIIPFSKATNAEKCPLFFCQVLFVKVVLNSFPLSLDGRRNFIWLFMACCFF